MEQRTWQAEKVRGLSVSCEQRLNAYALAAAAAGVSVLALAQQSPAKIIYTPTHHVIGDGDSYELDFAGNGTTDLAVQNKYNYFCSTDGSCFHSQVLGAKMPKSNQVMYNHFGAVAVKRGMEIGPKGALHGGLEIMAGFDSLSHTTSAFGSWINVKNRYLGVKFKIKGQTHYGWARLTVQMQLPLTITATLTGYAYETIPGKAIVAGATKGPDDAEPTEAFSSHAPEPATLGALALGAPGLSIWRRKESAAAGLAAN